MAALAPLTLSSPASCSVPPLVQSLYVHVPFCAHKCEYCAFYSHAPNGDVVSRYVQALVSEMRMIDATFRPRTVFFGGGTPSLLNLKHWESILKTMDELDWLGAEEWTVECNPATVSLDKARMLREHGVNRISMGVQSLHEPLLEKLGRIHTREMVYKSFDILRTAGFENINLDLMFAIPGQTREIWLKSLDEIAQFESEHLSCYEVIYEQDTPLYEQLQAGAFEVNEELACAMYEDLLNFCDSHGYKQYEVANFARNTRACQHNVNYWRGGAYYALGPSAAGYVKGVRTKNWSNTTMYCELVEKGERPIESRESLTPEARAGEIAAFGLRMNEGWSFSEFENRTGFDLRQGWSSSMASLHEKGWAIIDSQGFRLTPLGMRFADAAAEEFLR
jgi:oxygen-independent coproporphyrinogen-3 oxidase